MTVETGTAVRTEIVVEAPIERAFKVFTEEMETWWNPDHHIIDAPLAGMVVEPRVGGRIFDRGVDGSECQWSRVLAYEPPSLFVFSWDINVRWEIETDLAKTSEVAITFTAEGPERTRVELEHRKIERHGEGWEGMYEALASPGGWGGGLGGYAAAAEGRNYRDRVWVGAPIDAVFDALTTSEGLRGWWSAGAAATPEEGTTVRLPCQGDDFTEMRIDRLERPGVIEWTCTASHNTPFPRPDEWVGSRISVRLAEVDGGTRLELVHHGLAALKCFEISEADWTRNLHTSLKRYLEVGQGAPLG